MTNGAEENCHCSAFSGCAWKSVAGGTGAKLVCKTGAGDPACTAGTPPCAHDKCTAGVALDPECDPCVQQICDVDPYCCGTAWDGICVHEVQSVCGSLECNGTPSCGACIDDDRTQFVGGPGSGACHVFDGDQVNCEVAWHCSGSGHPATCWYDEGSESCNGCGPGNDGVNCTNTCLPPPVDGCDSPTMIPAGGGTFLGATSGTGVQGGTCGSGTAAAPEAVFEWTPATSGTASIDTVGSSFDTVLYIRSANCGAGTQLACNDDSFGLQSAISPAVAAGTTYFIFVDGYGGDFGSFVLDVTPPGAGSPSGAFLVPGGPVS